MSRRLIVSATVSALVAGAGPLSVLAHAAPAKPQAYPKAGCFTVTDPAGDGSFDGATPNNQDLDTLGFALESTRTDLIAFVKVAKLAAGPGSTDGHRYTLQFTFNGHVFSASGSSYTAGSGAVRDGLAQTGKAGHVVQLGVDTPQIGTNTDFVVKDRGYKTSGLTFTWDTKGSWVIADLPIADIQKYGGAKFKGILTDVQVDTQTDEYAVGSIWDTAGPTSWQVGKNTCFPAKKKK